MPSKKPKIQAYVSERLYNAVRSWKVANGIEGDSEAIERLISTALELPSDRDIAAETLSEIYQRLEAVEARLTAVERVSIRESTSNLDPIEADSRRITDKIEARIAELRQPLQEDAADGISQNALVALCRCSDRTIQRIRNNDYQLGAFTYKRTGQIYVYRSGRYFPTS